jgi:hypothetical protein
MSLIIKIFELLILLTFIHGFSETDTLFVRINSSMQYVDSIYITNDDWETYDIDISANPLKDTVGVLLFNPSHRSITTYLTIDSIILFGDSDTLLIDDFEDYDTLYKYYTSSSIACNSNDRWWVPYAASNGSGIGIAIKDDITKCLKVQYRNEMGEFVGGFQLQYIMAFRDWSNYHTIRLNIKRSFSDTNSTDSKTHVFWYKAETNNYPISDCIDGKGPCLPADAVIHEGMIATGCIAQHGGISVTLGTDCVILGSGPSDSYGQGSFIWINDLMDFEGTINSAKLRIEYIDGWAHEAFCNGGPINFRCGLADYKGNIEVWGHPDSVPATADWQDFLTPLSGQMGYQQWIPNLMAEETITLSAPQGRQCETCPSVLDSQFIEIDVTEQVQWILSHTGDNKDTLSGQYAIVCLSNIGDGSTGLISGYAFENCPGTDSIIGSDNAWTQDGNTAHIVVYGDLQPVSVEKKPEISTKNNIIGPIYPNPFNPSTSISYNLGLSRTGTLQIFDIRGKMVFERLIQDSGTFTWDASGLGSGVYVLKALSAGKTYSRKLVLQR